MTTLDVGTRSLPRDDDSRVEATEKVSVAELLRLVGQGDAAAWKEIVRRYGGVVFAAVRSFRLQEADVLDAVQMTWLRLAENAHRVRDPQRLGGWLTTTARREAMRILRHQTKHTLIPAEAMAERAADLAGGPEQRLIGRETEQILNELVAELAPSRRTLLRALFSDNPRRYRDVARTLGIPAGGIGPTRARALRQLQVRLDQLGLGPGGGS